MSIDHLASIIARLAVCVSETPSDCLEHEVASAALADWLRIYESWGVDVPSSDQLT